MDESILSEVNFCMWLSC